MAQVLVTGSADGLGRGVAERLLAGGHTVLVHARNPARRAALDDLAARGAHALVADLADPEQTRDLAARVNRLGRLDAVIHNAGVYGGRQMIPVNVVAPYLLTALIARPDRLIYLSSGMHRGGRGDLSGADWSGSRETVSYSETKLWVTALSAAIARRWPDVLSNAVDPGWVPTKMGGPGAPDDLVDGQLTQLWLAVGDDPDAATSGGYWHHRRRIAPSPLALDRGFQERLLAALAAHTGTALP